MNDEGWFHKVPRPGAAKVLNSDNHDGWRALVRVIPTSTNVTFLVLQLYPVSRQATVPCMQQVLHSTAEFELNTPNIETLARSVIRRRYYPFGKPGQFSFTPALPPIIHAIIC